MLDSERLCDFVVVSQQIVLHVDRDAMPCWRTAYLRHIEHPKIIPSIDQRQT